MRPRLLDLFCGAGGCSVGYNRAGFDVVGVDAAPMPRYPFEFHQGDALEYLTAHGHEFEAIHASPPCQFYSNLRHMPNAKKTHLDLVAPTRAALVTTDKPDVIENVPGAPLLNPTMLCGTMFGLGTGEADLRRHRLFETNWPLVLYFGMFCKHGRRGVPTMGLYGTDERARSVTEMSVRRTITVTGSHGDAGMSHTRQIKKRLKRPATVGLWGNEGGSSKRDQLLYFSTKERNEAMGIDWMKGPELSQAIPPAYCNFIGLQLIKYLEKVRQIDTLKE